MQVISDKLYPFLIKISILRYTRHHTGDFILLKIMKHFHLRGQWRNKRGKKNQKKLNQMNGLLKQEQVGINSQIDKAILLSSVQELMKSFKMKKSKLKKSKYPEKPKKAPNAYAIFFKQKSMSLRQENPDIEQQDITKAVAKEWKVMSDTQKLKYKEKEDQERQLQKETKSAYISNQVRRGKRFKISRPVDYPRKGKSAYVLFVADKKEIAKLMFEQQCRQAKIKHDKVVAQKKDWEGEKIWELKKMDKQRAIFSKLGELWNQLDQKRKEVYKAKAKQDKLRFQKELKAWKERNSVEDEFSAEGSLSSNSSSSKL